MSEALLKAAQDGDLQKLQHLVEEKGVSVNKKDEDGDTALHVAAQVGRLDMVKYLIDNGAAVNEKDKDGRTPLYFAAWGGYLDVVEYLIDKGAVLDDKDNIGKTPLHAAARWSNLDMVKYLIDRGADVNEMDNYGNTLLCQAALSGHLDVVKYLIDKGIDVNEKNKNDYTPLYFAVRDYHLDMVEYLIDNGADVNEKNNDGDTPLHYAANRGHTKTVKLLLDNGADIDLTDNKGRRALELTMKEEIRSMLTTYHKKQVMKRKLEYNDQAANTKRFHLAESKVTFLDNLDDFGYISVVKYSKGDVDEFRKNVELLELDGEDINAKTRVQLSDGTVESWSVLEYAVFMGYIDLVREILVRKDVQIIQKRWQLLRKAQDQQDL